MNLPTINTFPTVLTPGNGLPADAEAAEQLADDLHEAGFKVYVNRYGTGNGAHARYGDCGVLSIEVTGRWL